MQVRRKRQATVLPPGIPGRRPLASPPSALLHPADPQHLLLAAVPLSELTGRRVVLVYDASGSSGQLNAAARRLTTTLEEGLEVEVCGDAVALCAQPAAALTQADWQQLDNAIYDQLAGCFSQGRAPTQGELQQLVDDFKAGGWLSLYGPS